MTTGMRDIDDPLTTHIFAASQQFELIAFYSNRMTLCVTSQRWIMFLIIQPAADEDVLPNPERCPAWDEPVTEVEEYRSVSVLFTPWQYCSRCAEIVDAAFWRVKSSVFGFGTEFM